MSNSSNLAASFQSPGVAAAYVHRPPYPPEIFDLLDQLITGGPRTVLDLGAGEGALARPLAARVDHVDAVEISPAMVAAGRQRPGGERDNLTWWVEPAEQLSLPGPYGLVTAGASLHWMDWGATLRQIERVLAPGAVLAIVDQTYHELKWHDELLKVIVAHSRSRDYDPRFSLPDELERRGLIVIHGRHETAPFLFTQPTLDYIEQFHSTSSLARELMPPAEASRFDERVAAVVRPFETADRQLPIQTMATVVWCRPVPTGGSRPRAVDHCSRDRN